MTTLKHTIVFPLLAIALTGCASPDTTRREMTSWEGRPVKEPVGCARSTADVRRQAFLHLVWRGAQGSVAVPDVSTNARAPTRGTGYHMSQTQTYCERVAQVDEEAAAVIQSITWEGNGCSGFERKEWA